MINKIKIYSCILAIIIVGAFILSIAKHIFTHGKLYEEAEAMLPTIWALSHEMSSFFEKNKRLPVTVQEIDDFSDKDFSLLKKFNPVFITYGDRIFQTRINEKFGFYISNEFNPKWITNYEKEDQIQNKAEKYDTVR